MSTVKNLFVSHVSNKAGHCDSFSNCLLDPNSWMFTVVIRILWFVLKFITWKEDQENCQMMININQKLTYKEAEAPQRNFFLQKATIEVKQFIKTSQYQRISTEKMGYYITVDESCQLRRSKQLVKWLKSWKISAQTHFVCHWYINTHHLHTI